MKKEFKLKPSDYAFYRLLETNPEKWWSKEEIVALLPEHFEASENTHNLCSALNAARLNLNKGRWLGWINHLVLIDNNCFKLATTHDEVAQYCERDLNKALKILKRYWQNMGILKDDGQGKLIDCRGKVIDDESLAKQFFLPFDYE